MKSLKDVLKESLLDPEDVIMKSTDTAIITTDLYSHISEKRRLAIVALKNWIESYKVKPIKQLSKLKDVNGYIVEFRHMTPEDTDYNFIQFTHKTGDQCCTVKIRGVDTNISRSWLYTDWKNIKKEYDVKNCLVYIVPDELKEVFDILYKLKERY